MRSSSRCHQGRSWPKAACSHLCPDSQQLPYCQQMIHHQVLLLVQRRKAVSNFTQSWCRDRRTGSKNVTGSPSVLFQNPFLPKHHVRQLTPSLPIRARVWMYHPENTKSSIQHSPIRKMLYRRNSFERVTCSKQGIPWLNLQPNANTLRNWTCNIWTSPWDGSQPCSSPLISPPLHTHELPPSLGITVLRK